MWNVSGYANLTVYEVAPTIESVFANESNGSTVDINTWMCVNATATDVGVGMDKAWVTITYPNASSFNLTLSNTVIVINECGGAGSVYAGQFGVGDTGGTFSTGGPSWAQAWFANDTRNNQGANATNWTLIVAAANAAPYHNGTAGGAYPGPNWYHPTLGGVNTTPYPTGSDQRVFVSFWNDDGALDRYTLEWNETGSFVNQTWGVFASTNQSYGNYTVTIAAADEGKFISGRVWTNDTSNVFNKSDFVNLTVYEVAPVINPVFMNATNGSTVDMDDWLCVNATATDVGVGMDNVWVTITYPNASVFNLTLSNAGGVCGAGGSVYGGQVGVGDTVGTFSFGGGGWSAAWFANDTRNNQGINVTNQTVTVVSSAALKIAEFRLWQNDSTVIGDYTALADLKCTGNSTFGNNVSSVYCNNTAPGVAYRAEIRVCNDGGATGASASFLYLNHSNTTADFANYIGSFTANNCGHEDNGTAWNATNCAFDSARGVISVENETANQGIQIPSAAARSNTNCEWYAYKFTSGGPDWIVNVNTTMNTTSVSSGTNPTAGNVSINVTYSETAFAMFYPSTGCTSDEGTSGETRPNYPLYGANAACGTTACDVHLAIDKGYTDGTTNAVMTDADQLIYYNFSGPLTGQAKIYLTVGSITQDSYIHFWNYSSSSWDPVKLLPPPGSYSAWIPVNSSNYMSNGFMNVSFNLTADGTFQLGSVWYWGNSTRCLSCYFAGTADTNNVGCQGQTGALAFWDFENLGSIVEQWKVSLDSDEPSGVNMFMNDSSASVSMTTSEQTLNASVEIFEHAYAWGWANFTLPLEGSYLREVYSNATT